MAPSKSTPVPYTNPIADASGIITSAWQFFFQSVYEILTYLGLEQTFTLVNNTAVATNIATLNFDRQFTSQVSVDYLIQRTTSLNEAVETGTFYLAYKPKTNTWAISNGPTASGITLTVTTSGQVKYTSTNQTGTLSISRIVFRCRLIAAKSNLYSKVGS